MRKILFSTITVFLISMSLWAHDHNESNLEFVENKTQWHENVAFRCEMSEGVIYLENNAFTYSFYDANDIAMFHDAQHYTQEEKDAFMVHGYSWKMNFLNSLSPELTGMDKQSHYYNYFRGNDESKWAGNVSVYHEIEYQTLYEGVDLRVYSSNGNLKYDWVIAPNMNPSQILFSLEGIESPYLEDGKLMITTDIGLFMESEPYAYQMINGVEVEVPCMYKIENGTISYEFPEGYDENNKLVIDPELIAATLSGTGGFASNYGHTATFDDAGNIYTGCISFNSDYPTSTGAFQESYGGGGTDCGISKLSPDGSTLIWASFIGGDGSDNPHSMVCNNLGELYVYGSTSSIDFPVTATAFQSNFGGGGDIFITHFSFTGEELIGSTYVGGSDQDGVNSLSVNYGDAYRGEIVMDFDDKPVIASCSSSIDFPTSGGAYQNSLSGMQDGVMCRFNANLSSMEVGTYMGGPNNDNSYSVRVAADGSIYVVGGAGAGYPVTTGAYQTNFLGGELGGWNTNEADGFISRFTSTGSGLLASTYYGTEDGDQIFFIDLDNNDDVYVYGQGGVDLPVMGDVYVNPNSAQFVSKLNGALNSVELSTTIGSGGTGWGNYDFIPDAFLVDNCNNVYLSGYSANAGSLELTADALYTTGGFYLVVLNENMEELEYATMYTGDHVDGGTSRFDKNGTVYQAVCSGGGFATTDDAYAEDQSTGWDVGVFKINFDVSGVNSSIGGSDVNGCAPFETTFNNYSTGDQYFWDLGDGTTSNEFEPTHTYTNPGVYQVTLIATDSLSCNLADTATFEITISTPLDFTPSFSVVTDCSDLSATITNDTDVDFLEYIWDFGDGTVVEGYEPTHIYSDPGDYTIFLTAVDNGCINEDTTSTDISIYGEVFAAIDNPDIEGCAPFTAVFDNASSGAVFDWDFGDGSPNGTEANVSHVYTTPGIYDVTLIVEGSGGCEGQDTTTATVTVIEPQVSSAFELDQTQGCEELFIETNNLSVGDGITYSWNFGDGEISSDENPTHNYIEPGTYVVQLSIYDDVCESNFVSEQVIELTTASAYDVEDVPICYHADFVTVDGNTTSGISSFLWSNNETTSTVEIAEPGEYFVTAFIDQCWLTDDFEVYLAPEISLIDSVEICKDSKVILDISYPGATSVEWCDYGASDHLIIDSEGSYCYTFTDEYGCDQTGEYLIATSEDLVTLFIPNSFTPNEDGINDLFVPQMTNINSFELSIYDRWGTLLFQTLEEGEKWNGSLKNNKVYYVPDGVYTYELIYKSNSTCDLEAQKSYGTINVMR